MMLAQPAAQWGGFLVFFPQGAQLENNEGLVPVALALL
jgi:hypothetical protein